MAVEAVVYFGILLLIEFVLRTPELLYQFTPVPNVQDAAIEEDSDVLAEEERVKNGGANDDMVILNGLRKVYRARLAAQPKVAVRNISFGVHQGECFGFLGINGAGKTTTLQMLTGDTIPSRGAASLGGCDIMTQQTQVRKLMGYCPQFDALIETLTAREHLYMYARIKGMREQDIPFFVTAMIQRLGLSEYADRPCGGYSGGNKRKLSVGIALIGNPKVVFLDEPTTGVDVNSKRSMWELISSTMAGRSVILTTHSMEECEALCSRIGIMVGGRLRCLGGAQHLKHKYGDGYQIDVSTGRKSIAQVKQFFSNNLQSAIVIEEHSSNIKYRVPRQHFSLSQLFRMLEAHKAELNISDYSVSETTLEQIFIHFARQQEEETGQVAGFGSADMVSVDLKDDEKDIHQE